MRYLLKNGKSYEVESFKGCLKVTEKTSYFDNMFESISDITYLDNMTEVREYLTEKNGGEEVW